MLSVAPPLYADTLTIFAASSLKPVLDDISTAYEDTAALQISYAGSALLARQITQGAPADVFLSANTAWMDVVVDAGVSVQNSVVNVASNRLALVAHGEHTASEIPPILTQDSAIFAQMFGERISMGLVEAVPVGQYGRAALMHLQQWDHLAPNVVQSDNARAALTLVALGEVPYGVAYASDAMSAQATERVSVLGIFPETSHPEIIYAATQIEGAAPDAADFLAYLSSDAAQQIFKAHGFKSLLGEN